MGRGPGVPVAAPHLAQAVTPASGRVRVGAHRRGVSGRERRVATWHSGGPASTRVNPASTPP